MTRSMAPFTLPLALVELNSGWVNSCKKWSCRCTCRVAGQPSRLQSRAAARCRAAACVEGLALHKSILTTYLYSGPLQSNRGAQVAAEQSEHHVHCCSELIETANAVARIALRGQNPSPAR